MEACGWIKKMKAVIVAGAFTYLCCQCICFNKKVIFRSTVVLLFYLASYVGHDTPESDCGTRGCYCIIQKYVLQGAGR